MSADRPQRTLVSVPIESVDDPDIVARAEINEDRLAELAESISRRGLIQPIGVVANNGRYTVVYGHRRLLASRKAGLTRIEAFVYPHKSAALEGDKYAENRFREDLKVTEEAALFTELLEQECAGDVDRLCALIGEKRDYVERRLLLFSGDADIFQALDEGLLSIGVAEQLNRCTEERWRKYLLHESLRQPTTIATAAGWIETWRRRTDARGGPLLAEPSDVDTSQVPPRAVWMCSVCHGQDHPERLEQLVVHDYCRLAHLEPLMKTLRGEGQG